MYRLTQDSKGLIWIATDAGVCSFDGKTFKTYTREDGLPSLDVLSTIEDQQGRIWFKTFAGTVSYFKDGVIHNPTNTPLLKGISTQAINDSYIPRKDGVWIICDTAFVLVTEDTVFRHSRTILPGNEYDANIGDWLGSSDKGMHMYSRGGLYHHKGHRITYDHCWDAGIAIDVRKVNGAIYITRPEGIYRHLNEKEELIYPARDGDRLEHMYIVSTFSKGVWLKDTKGALFQLVEKDGIFELEPFLLGYTIGHVLIDHEGNTWVATQEKGLLFFPKYGVQKEFLKDSLDIYSCAYDEASKSIYAGMEKGHLAQKTGHTTHTYQVNCTYRSSLNKISSIIVDTAVWFGSECFAGQINQQQVINLKQTQRESIGAVKNMLLHEDVLYFATSSGLFSSNTNNQTFPKKLYDQRLFDVCIDRDGAMLFAGRNGIFKYPETKKPYITLPEGTMARNIELLGNYLIAGTTDNGLFLYLNDTILHLTRTQGLLANFCSDLVAQNDSVFWYSSSGGVDKIVYHKKDQSFSIYNLTKHEGLIDQEIRDLELAPDFILAASSNAIVRIPLDFNDKPTTSSFFFSSVSVGDSIFRDVEALSLNYDHKPLACKFRSVNFISGDRLKYSYRLVGQNNDWIETDKNELTFYSLNPGEYELQIRAVGINGNNPAAPLTLKISVAPPFWQTIWFILAIIGLVVVLAALISYFVIQSIKKREEAKTEANSRIALSELRALQAQMNPHFIYNALTSIQTFILSNEKDTASRYLSKFAKLMRLTLDSSRASQVPLEDEVKLLKNYLDLEQQRLNHNFEYQIEVDPALDVEEVYLPPLFVQPLVENAIKHGLASISDKKGTLVLSFQQLEEELLVTVTDNGAGMAQKKTDASKSHRSHATGIIQDRIKNFNQLYDYNIRLEYTEEDPSTPGTTVHIYLPFLTEFDD